MKQTSVIRMVWSLLLFCCIGGGLAAPIPAQIFDEEARFGSYEAGSPEESGTAQDPVQRRIEDLENRVRDLEQGIDEASAYDPDAETSSWPDWLRRFRLSGNADIVFFEGERNSKAEHGEFVVENARLFFDVDLADNVMVSDSPLVEYISFFFEWDLYRDATFRNDAGSVYVRFDGILGSKALNLKFGRMPIPYGEEYLRFHEQRPENPLISFSAPSPYGWDEGILLFGSNLDESLEYFFAVMDGDAQRNVNTSTDPQIVAKVACRPAPWLYVSLSGLHTGKIDGRNSPAPGESGFILGGFYFAPFGLLGDVPNFQNGVAVPDDPELELESGRAAEIDVILEDDDLGRLWLAYGQAKIKSGGSAAYDRDLTYWIAEGILELSRFFDCLESAYLAARYSAIGTFQSDEGALLPVMNDAVDLGYNVERVDLVSLGFGYRLSENVVFKAEYSWLDFEMVNGVTPEIRGRRRARNFLATGVTVSF